MKPNGSMRAFVTDTPVVLAMRLSINVSVLYKYPRPDSLPIEVFAKALRSPPAARPVEAPGKKRPVEKQLSS